MGLQEKINEDLKSALKSGNELELSVLRMVSAAIHNKEIEKRTKLAKVGKASEALGEEEIEEVIRSEVKKRREASELYEKGGREDLAKKEEGESKVLEAYLPPALEDEALKQAISEILKKIENPSPKDLGRVLTDLREEFGTRVDMAKASRFVKETLSEK